MSTMQSATQTATGQLVHATEDDVQWHYLLGDAIAILHRGEATGGRFEFIILEAEEGGGPPFHSHPEAEAFYVLEGAFDFTSFIDGEFVTVRGRPGDALHVPGGVPHNFRGAAAAGSKVAIVSLPAGRAGFFDEVATSCSSSTRHAQDRTPPDMERLKAAAQRHRVTMCDPAQGWGGASAQFTPAAESMATTRQIAGEICHVALAAEHTGGGLVFVDNSSQPGALVPMHSHPQPEVFYVLDGEYELSTLDGHGHELSFRARPGSAVYIPASAPHAFRNVAAGPSRCLACFNGTDILGFFELGHRVADRAELLATPFELNMAELAPLLTAGAKFGMKF